MRVIYCYNYSKFFISHRLPLINKIRESFVKITFLGNILDEDFLIIKKNTDSAFDTNISKGSMNIFKVIYYYLAFPYKKIKKKNQYDLIEIATLKGLVISLPIIIRNKNAKIVIWVCGLGTVFLSKKINYLVLRFFIFKIYKHLCSNYNTSWIFENFDDRDFFKKKLAIKTKNTIVIPGSGYDYKHTQSKDNIQKNKIVFIGRLIKDKGIVEYIEALKQILAKNDYDKWDFEILGDFDDNPTSIKKHDLINLVGSFPIKFIGFVENMKVYYQKVYCVVLPSYREGLSRVLIEAGAHSIPSITTNVTGCRDIIQNDINGILVQPKNSVDLSIAIKKLINNPDKAKKMGNNAREIFKKHYSLKKISEKTLVFYKRI